MDLGGCTEVEVFIQEKRRNDTCHLPLNIHYLVLFLPYHILPILRNRSEFFSKP